MHRRLARLSLTAAAAVAAVLMPVALPSANAFLANLVETASLASPTAVPGSTVRATGTFTASTDLGSIRVSVNLLGTGGAGSVSFVSASGRLTNCSVDLSTNRSVACDFLNATVADGTQQIVVDINVGAGATIGGSWSLETGSGILNQAGSLSGNTQTLTIVAPPTTTTAPTTTVSPTTAPATTAVAGSGNGLPSVGSSSETMLVAVLFLVLGGVAVGASRRRVTR
jgi:hypothetical protein